MGMSAQSLDDSFIPCPGNHRELRNALGQFCTGVKIVTANTDAGPVAITVNSFASVSLEPALVLWSIERESSRYKHFSEAENFSIHVLSGDQESLCMGVARDPAYIKKQEIPPRTNCFGVPVFDCLVRFDCTKQFRYEAGDHDIIVGGIELVTTLPRTAPLAFYEGKLATVTKIADNQT